MNKYGILVVVTALSLFASCSQKKSQPNTLNSGELVKEQVKEKALTSSSQNNDIEEKTVVQDIKVTEPVSESKVTATTGTLNNTAVTNSASKAIVKTKQTIDSNTPMSVIQKYTKDLKQYVNVPNSSNRDKKIAQRVRQYFDFSELAKRSLGKHWSGVSASQRKEYSKLFIELVEKSYLKKSRDIVSDYAVSFKNEKIKGSKATVYSTVSRKDADLDINYNLHKKNNKWMIYNITMDDVNLVRTYQSQFNKIINDKGFSSLIAMMKKRLKSTDNVDV